MARIPRAEVFAPDEVAIVHVMNRVVRRCYLLGDDPVVFGDNYPSALTTMRIPGVVGGNFLLPGGGQNGRRP